MSQNETHFDVAIIGAGFSGTMVAVHLFKEVSEILSYVRSSRPVPSLRRQIAPLQ
jgi:cation diffusion facilitator CzcD-associated flavoprotein CzcO